MAIKPFVITVAPGTLSTAPAQTNLVFDPAIVVGIELIIPPGHNGLTGIALAQGHQPVLPDGKGDFIIGSGEKIEWPLDNFLDTGNWSAFAYNTAKVVHTFYVRFLVQTIRSGEASQPVVSVPLQLT
jgi:hypothetical protein